MFLLTYLPTHLQETAESEPGEVRGDASAHEAEIEYYYNYYNYEVPSILLYVIHYISYVNTTTNNNNNDDNNNDDNNV